MRKFILTILAAGLWAAPVWAEPNTGSSGLKFTCGEWGPSTTKTDHQCRRCERCSTTSDGKIDCTRVEVKNQCTKGDTKGIDPPTLTSGGTNPRPPRRPPNAGAIGQTAPKNAQ